MIDKLQHRIPIRVRKRIKQRLALLRKLMGINHYYGLNGLDRKVEPYLPQYPGVFVEVGANDGISQSNTWVLEAYRGWTGLLIEPVDWLADMCESFRRSKTIRAVLTEFSREGEHISFNDADLVTRIRPGEVPSSGSQVVLARSLSSVLDEHSISNVDFFSLDVEGSEIDVLKGIDFDRHYFGAILVETKSLGPVEGMLETWFSSPVALSHHDYLFLNRTGFAPHTGKTRR